MSKASPDTKIIDTAPTLNDLKSLVDEPNPFPDMPKIGDRVLLSSVFGRMVHPINWQKEHEINVDTITRVTFDWWHEMCWKAGQVRRAED